MLSSWTIITVHSNHLRLCTRTLKSTERAAPDAGAALLFFNKAEFPDCLRALLPLVGLYLPMYGTMFVHGMQDVEGDCYESARKLVGPKCLMSASYDLQGNISKRVIDNLD